MAAVGSVNTAPEIAVRRLIYALGYRYRLHARELPGKPDLVFRPRRKAIFVHGCFWHRHPGCKKATVPKSRRDYWLPKLRGNRERDLAALAALKKAGWKTLVVWQCELAAPDRLRDRLRRFLSLPRGAA
jgi:DNA mismatch endonuclease, patch repair protein